MAERIPKIVVIGPAYVDMAVKCQTFPVPGNAVEGSSFSCSPTGAAVNRAIQAAVCGCSVSVISRVGDDCFGQLVVKNLLQYNIQTDLVYKANAISTGIIITIVDSRGGNSICFCTGANRAIGRDEIEYAAAEEAIASCDACLISGELSQEAIVSAIRTAHIHKRRTVLDVCLPTHSRETLAGLNWPMEYFNTDILILRFSDFTCASELGSGGVTELKMVGMDLVAKGTSCVVMSLGWRGALIVDRQSGRHIPGVEMDVVDNNAAMDAFCGALAAACCAAKDSTDSAVRFAVAAEALTRSRFGGQDAIGKKDEIISLLQRQPD